MEVEKINHRLKKKKTKKTGRKTSLKSKKGKVVNLFKTQLSDFQYQKLLKERLIEQEKLKESELEIPKRFCKDCSFLCNGYCENKKRAVVPDFNRCLDFIEKVETEVININIEVLNLNVS